MLSHRPFRRKPTAWGDVTKGADARLIPRSTLTQVTNKQLEPSWPQSVGRTEPVHGRWVGGYDMVTEQVATSEGPRARIARVGALPRVPPAVALEVRKPGEGPGTLLARVRSDAVVAVDVLPEVVACRERGRAAVARERPFAGVGAPVSLQLGLDDELLGAKRAAESLVADVPVHVTLQVAVLGERRRAQVAAEPRLARVRHQVTVQVALESEALGTVLAGKTLFRLGIFAARALLVGTVLCSNVPAQIVVVVALFGTEVARVRNFIFSAGGRFHRGSLGPVFYFLDLRIAVQARSHVVSEASFFLEAFWETAICRGGRIVHEFSGLC